IQFCQNGDLDALDKLLYEHFDYILRYIYSISKNKSFYMKENILFKLIHEFKYCTFACYRLIWYTCKYFDVDTLRKIYNTFPELPFWTQDINRHIVECIIKHDKYDILTFLGEINSEYDKSKVAYHVLENFILK